MGETSENMKVKISRDRSAYCLHRTCPTCAQILSSNTASYEKSLLLAVPFPNTSGIICTHHFDTVQLVCLMKEVFKFIRLHYIGNM